MPSEELVVGALRGVGCGCPQRICLRVPSEELVEVEMLSKRGFVHASKGNVVLNV